MGRRPSATLRDTSEYLASNKFESQRGLSINRRSSLRRMNVLALSASLGITFSAAFALSAVPAAQAFEIFGKKFFEGDKPSNTSVPDPLPYSAELSVVGSQEDDLQDKLSAASTLVTKEDEAPSGQAGLISRGLSDVKRILGQLYANGYYGSTVSIRFNGTLLEETLESGKIPGPRPVETLISVDAGSQFQFGEITVLASGPGAEDLPKDPLRWDLISGEPARSGKILNAEQKIELYLRKRGYPTADIGEREIVADHATRKLDVSLPVETGPKAVFGAVTVSGTEVTDPAFVERYALIPEGEIYSPETLDKSRKRLNDLGIFSSVRLVEGTVQPDGSLPISIEVSERKRHVVGAGASWSSTEGIGLEAYWRRRNLFGKGELLSIEGSVGRLSASSFTDMEYATRIAFDKPGAFGPQTSFSTALSAAQEAPDAYTSRTVKLEGYYKRTFSETLSGQAGGEISFSNEEDVYGTQDYLLVGTPVGLTYDSRDNVLDPTEGFYLKADVEPAYDTIGGEAMLFTRATGSTYYALDEANRFILAGKVSVGSILAPSIRSVPASRRLIAGGGGSIRGYAYRNVGPRVNGEVAGGRSLVELSGEVRVKVTDTLGVVAFVDAGNAYEDALPDFSQPLKFGVGAGIRYYTPIGPLRVDAAMPLDPGQDDPDFALYVGLSQAF
ncbi:autotransporter assembly complex protein TamA [Roseibium sp.]|uniref:autotransporter assembly complex protein TamA n=1 Tax=Roseibium sp. TaxID=1936156 RepID=UPI003A97F59E